MPDKMFNGEPHWLPLLSGTSASLLYPTYDRTQLTKYQFIVAIPTRVTQKIAFRVVAQSPLTLLGFVNQNRLNPEYGFQQALYTGEPYSWTVSCQKIEINCRIELFLQLVRAPRFAELHSVFAVRLNQHQLKFAGSS